jgi:hypothetical protein
MMIRIMAVKMINKKVGKEKLVKLMVSLAARPMT